MVDDPTAAPAGLMDYANANAVEVERAFTRGRRWLTASIQALLVATATGAEAAKVRALSATTLGIQFVLRMGDFMGRVGVMQEVAQHASPTDLTELEPSGTEAPPAPPIYPEVPEFPGVPKPGRPPVFREAYEAIISRQPKVIRDPLRRTAEEVGRLYQEEKVFALAKSAEEAVTKRVRDLIAEGISEGRSVGEVTKQIQTEIPFVAKKTHDWSRAYVETVVRTNLTGAQTAGRFEQAKKPIARKIMPAMIFRAVGDVRTRPNHKACHGAAAPVEHPLWKSIHPPLGYNCRCRVDLVSWDQARRMGLVNEDGTIEVRPPKSGGGPDPGFVHGGGMGVV